MTQTLVGMLVLACVLPLVAWSSLASGKAVNHRRQDEVSLEKRRISRQRLCSVIAASTRGQTRPAPAGSHA